jgi:hypothetical protein
MVDSGWVGPDDSHLIFSAHIALLQRQQLTNLHQVSDDAETSHKITTGDRQPSPPRRWFAIMQQSYPTKK